MSPWLPLNYYNSYHLITIMITPIVINDINLSLLTVLRLVFDLLVTRLRYSGNVPKIGFSVGLGLKFGER